MDRGLDWQTTLWVAIIGGLIVAIPGGIIVLIFEFWIAGKRDEKAKKEAERREKLAVDAAQLATARAHELERTVGGWWPNHERQCRHDLRRETNIYWGAMDPSLDPDPEPQTTGPATTTPGNELSKS